MPVATTSSTRSDDWKGGRAVFSAIGLVKWKKQCVWIINSILSGLSFRKRLGTVHILPEQTAFVVGLI